MAKEELQLGDLYLEEEMAKEALQFGDKNTVDVRLHLIGSSGKEGRGDPLLLHSQVLKKAEFFETKLSERWSSDKRPFEIEVTSAYSGENYIKFIEFMYSYYAKERFYFSSVDEALTILPVASEVMFHDCIAASMQYLDAVRLSPEQKAKLRALLSSMQINILPALAVRLGMRKHKSDCGHIEVLKEFLQESLSMASTRPTIFRDTAAKHMSDYFDSNASPAVKDACRDAVLKVFNTNVEAIKSKSDKYSIRLAFSTLHWLVGVIQLCDVKLLETVFKVFCEDTQLRNSITTHAVIHFKGITRILIIKFLKSLGNGNIITPSSLRVSFLTNWADTIVEAMAIVRQKWNGDFIAFQDLVLNIVIDVAETLALADQKVIYKCWKDALTKKSMNTISLFNWWADKVHDAIMLDIIN